MDDYPQEQRECFEYHVAGLLRHADPLAAHLELTVLLDGEPNAVLRRMKYGETAGERYEATRQVEAASRQVFGLAPFDPQSGGGCHLEDALGVLREFILYAKKKANNGGAGPGSPSPASPESCPAPCPTSASSP